MQVTLTEGCNPTIPLVKAETLPTDLKPSLSSWRRHKHTIFSRLPWVRTIPLYSQVREWSSDTSSILWGFMKSGGVDSDGVRVSRDICTLCEMTTLMVLILFRYDHLLTIRDEVCDWTCYERLGLTGDAQGWFSMENKFMAFRQGSLCRSIHFRFVLSPLSWSSILHRSGR
jgi:hypothetical protein